METIDETARERLTLPDGCCPHDEIARYRRYMKYWRQRLQALHNEGRSGLEVCRAQTRVLDGMLVQICQSIRRLYQKTYGKKKIPVVALIALGSYGRRELNPCSDIDLMLLHDGELSSQLQGTHPFMELANQQLLYTLYDLHLSVGHSVRTLDECVELANRDMLAKTSLIETRRIAGNRQLYLELQKRVFQECIKHHEKEYVKDRQRDQLLRHEKYGASPTMLEPNLKNGCGGLRDFHNLIWLSWFKLHTWNLEDLHKSSYLTGRELSQLRKAHDFLLRVRNELHYLNNRATDILFKSSQPTVATHLGYTDKSPRLRIEKFMQALYTHMRNIYLISRTLEQRFALTPEKGILPSLTSLIRRKSYSIDGFKVVNGCIRAPKTSVFKRDPGRLMRLFLVAQQRGLALHPDLIHHLRGLESLSNDAFRRNALVRDTFLDILHQRGSVAPVLRLMHETGLLGDYLPEFDKLTCLVQHEFFHRYTVDEHTLMCIEELDRVWQATGMPYSQFEDIFQKIENPHILYLALLLHDVGKGQHSRKPHEIVSRELARQVAERIGLSETDTDLLLFLVENHLYLFEIASHKDIYDPSVIQEVADRIETPERLKLLLLLSFADTLGTSRELWTGYKELFLWSIYNSVMRCFSDPRGEAEVIETVRQRRKLIRDILQKCGGGFSWDEVDEHLNLMTHRYHRVFPAQQIARHLEMIRGLKRGPAADPSSIPTAKINWERLLHQGCSRVTICAYHQRGLFNKICGALTASGLTIFNAQIFMRQDGISLNTFHVLNAEESDLPTERCRKEFAVILDRALMDAVNLEELVEKRYKNRPSFEPIPQEHFSFPTEVSFDQESARKYTVVQIQTEDFIGLLYTLTRALSRLGTDIVASHSFTEKGVAIDRFLITDCIGNKIIRPDRLRTIETVLRQAIENLKLKAAQGKKLKENEI